MLDICIFEKDYEIKNQLKNICFSYLMNKNYEADVLDFSEDNKRDTAALYMLMYYEQIANAAKKIRSENSQSYIVVLAENMKELSKAVCPSVCPSGYLLKPPEKDDVEAVLDEIYTDYMRCTGSEHNNGIFHFKQKSKEYSVPFDRILLFESSNKKVIVRTDVQEFEFYDTLDSVLKTAPECFMQIHKSFVINLSRVESVDYANKTVILDDGSAAFLSRTYKNELKQRLREKEGGRL